jgi:hypothetical protein
LSYGIISPRKDKTGFPKKTEDISPLVHLALALALASAPVRVDRE